MSCVAALAAALLCLLPAGALAAGNPPGEPAPISAPPGSPTLISDKTSPPTGFRLTANQVLKIASANLTVEEELRKHPKLVPYEYTRGPGVWQVSWFTPPPRIHNCCELLQLYVSDATGQVRY